MAEFDIKRLARVNTGSLFLMIILLAFSAFIRVRERQEMGEREGHAPVPREHWFLTGKIKLTFASSLLTSTNTMIQRLECNQRGEGERLQCYP